MTLASRGQCKAHSDVRYNHARYPVLPAWPELEPPQVVHLNVGIGTYGRVIRLSARMLRSAGLTPEAGVHVAVYNGKALVWNGLGKRYLPLPGEHGIFIPLSGLSKAVLADNFTLIQGPGYLIVTSAEEAKTLAPNTAHAPYPFTRVKEDLAFSLERDFAKSQVNVLAWQDVRVRATWNSGRKYKLLQATVTGLLWEIAGLKADDCVRFFRYRNATLVEKATEANFHVRIKNRKGSGHFAIGVSLFDVRAEEVVRVVSTPLGLLVCSPSSDIGQLCESSRRLPVGPNRQRKFFVSHPDAACIENAARPTPINGTNTRPMVATLGGASLTYEGSPKTFYFSDKNTSIYPMRKSPSRLQVQGNWLKAYGFVPGARYRIEPHPLSSARRLAVLDDAGPYQVTTLSGDTPKMYVPWKHIENFKCAEVKVFGMPEGIHIQRYGQGSPGSHNKKSPTASLTD